MVTISAGFNELNISAGGMHPAKVSRSVRLLLHGRTSPCFYSWTWLGPARDWWVTTIQLILNPLVSALKTTTGQHLMCRVIWRKHKDISLWYISQHGMVQIVEIYAYGWQGPKSFSQYHVCWWPHGARSWIDPAHKSNNTTDKYPTMHHFVKEMCKCMHILQNCAWGIWDWCIVEFVRQVNYFNATVLLPVK